MKTLSLRVGRIAIILLAFFLAVPVFAARKNNVQSKDDPRQSFLGDIPASPGSVILGRPTDRSITASVLWVKDTRIVIHYGADESMKQHSEMFTLKGGEPREIILDNLRPNASYQYRVIDTATKKPLLPVDGTGRFHTQRSRGESFTFTIQADSHLDGFCMPEMYETMLRNALSSRPDFHIDLGDTFMTGKIPKRSTAARQYTAQHHWLGLIGHSAPVFLVLGNHDGEEARKKEAVSANGIAVWSCLQRKRYFPNPIHYGFYTGNTIRQPYAGDLQNYYAWEWGDAQFVVLDPYWYSGSTRGGKEPWNMTLGKTQYDWLAKTLRTSTTKFKFVFIHQLVGGLDKGARGGAEAARLFEWGGHDKTGANRFANERPGWQQPIHDLLVETGVTIVFHGHDHFFAHQQLDGVTYQLVPQPAHRNFRNHHAEEYGYIKGDFLPNSGHLNVRVTPEQTTVAYIRSATPSIERRGITNGNTAFIYSCKPRLRTKK
ncbi:metallophosphoesterase family protein [Candidatus Hydrogenedentota bacterium]